MSTSIPNLKRTYTRVPHPQAHTHLDKVVRVSVGTALFPFYWLGARLYGLPGLSFGVDSFRLGMRSLINNKGDISHAEIYRMLFAPVESTRYFEFGLAWEYLSDIRIGRYLDVSSPRLFPLALLAHRPKVSAELINPNQEDLTLTAGLVRACGMGNRCNVSHALIEEVAFPESTFDVITSLSVVEHISADQNAVLRMWELLKPRGKLILSVPCAAAAEEQYIDVDQFNLQRCAEDGFFFLQYVYDDALLRERFYSVLGPPIRHGIYGEKKPGTLRRGLVEKWAGGKYPRWKEPYTMAQHFEHYDSLDDLPGEGVIVMEFEKK